MRITFPVAVILKRLAASRCVLSLSFFTFLATNISSLKFSYPYYLRQASACLGCVDLREKLTGGSPCYSFRLARRQDCPALSLPEPRRRALAREGPSKHSLPCAARFSPGR